MRTILDRDRDTRRKSSPYKIVLGLLVLVALGALLSMFLGYPPRIDPYINDYASIINFEDRQELKRLLLDFERENNVKVSVLTIPSYRTFTTREDSLEEFAYHLFKVWDMDSDGKGQGMLILVSLLDREVRIEFGGSYEKKYNVQTQYVINRYMLPNFRNHQYSSGILQGARAMTSILAGRDLVKPEFPKELSFRSWWAEARQDHAGNLFLFMIAFTVVAAFVQGNIGGGIGIGGGDGGGGDGGGDGGGGDGGSGDGGGGGW